MLDLTDCEDTTQVGSFVQHCSSREGGTWLRLSLRLSYVYSGGSKGHSSS